MGVTMDEMIWVGDLFDDDPLISEPVVDERYVHCFQTEDSVTISDEKNPLAWITSDTVVELGGDG